MSEWKAAALAESEAQWRQFLSYLFKQQVGGQAGFAVAGVVAGLGVTQTTTASASVVVAAGAGVVQSTVTTGVEPLLSNADKTLDILTGSPMGALPRNDVIVFDPSTATVRALIGTPNASPSDPSIPGYMLVLARVRNAANATSIPASAIDDLRQFTTLNVPAPTQSTTYNPVWSQIGGTNLSVGSGTLTGRYFVTAMGSRQLCTVEVVWTRAADTNVGTAAYVFSLPLAGLTLNGTGQGFLLKSGEKPLTVRMITGQSVVLVDNANNRISNSNPGSWAAGDSIQFTLTYFLP